GDDRTATKRAEPAPSSIFFRIWRALDFPAFTNSVRCGALCAVALVLGGAFAVGVMGSCYRMVHRGSARDRTVVENDGERLWLPLPPTFPAGADAHSG